MKRKRCPRCQQEVWTDKRWDNKCTRCGTLVKS